MTTTNNLRQRLERIEAQRNPPEPPIIRVCWGDCEPGTCSICDPENSPPGLVITWSDGND